MFEMFTEGARRVVVLSQEEVRTLGHSQISTGHLLLGLIGEGEGLAYRALESMGVTLSAARDAMADLFGKGEGSPDGHIPFARKSKESLERSLREAVKLGHSYIGTEHLLLGLIAIGDGAVDVLSAMNIDPADVREQIIAWVDDPSLLLAAQPKPVREIEVKVYDGERSLLEKMSELMDGSIERSEELLVQSTALNEQLQTELHALKQLRDILRAVHSFREQ